MYVQSYNNSTVKYVNDVVKSLVNRKAKICNNLLINKLISIFIRNNMNAAAVFSLILHLAVLKGSIQYLHTGKIF